MPGFLLTETELINMGCFKAQTNKQTWARPIFCKQFTEAYTYGISQDGLGFAVVTNVFEINTSALEQPGFISHLMQAHHGSAMPLLHGIFTPGSRHSAHASDLLPLRKKEMNEFAEKQKTR